MLNHTLEYSESVDSFMRRHFIKPGISGWAQVNGLRGNLNQNLMEERVKYDLYYIKNWSIWVDFEILFKTILITIFGDEAAY
jgi:putative colanic acid biosynthesis UDP-glucose lipid carrier transferase